MFLNGQFGCSALCAVQLLEKTDENGLFIIDNGRTTVQTMLEIMEAFEKDPELDPNGSPWHSNLVDVFEQGLPVAWVVYEQDDPRTRKLWNIYKHDEDNNKFDTSSVSSKIRAANDSLQAACGDRQRAMNE